MNKSVGEIQYFKKSLSYMLKHEQKERIMTECRKYNLTSAYAMDIIKYIDPKARQTSFLPKIIIQWINDEYLMDSRLKEKNLLKIPKEEQSKYNKYRVGREIKVRYRFKDQTKKYQDIKLTELYYLKLYKYLKRNGY